MTDNLSMDEKTGATRFDSARSYKMLEEIGKTQLFTQVLDRNAKRVKAQTEVVKAEGNRQAANWNLFAENWDSNPEIAQPALQKVVPGATNVKRNQADSGFIIDKEDGSSVEIGDDDIGNQNRTAQEEAQARALDEQKAAALASPGTQMALYQAARQEAEEMGYDFPYEGYTQWALALAKANTADMGFSAQTAMNKINASVFAKMKDKAMEASSKVFLARHIQTLLKNTDMATGPGTILKMKWNQALATLNNITSANIFDINPDLPFWQQTHQSFMKIAYGNREEFMPGQLSNMENMKLLEMEASLNTTALATKMILEGLIAHDVFKRRMMGEYRKWMLPKSRGGTDGTMVKTINGVRVGWEDYQQEQIDKESKKRQKIVQDHIDKYQKPEDALTAEEQAELEAYESGGTS